MDNHLFLRSGSVQRKMIEKARERGEKKKRFAPVHIRATGETDHTSTTRQGDNTHRNRTSSSTTATAQGTKKVGGPLISYDPGL